MTQIVDKDGNKLTGNYWGAGQRLPEGSQRDETEAALRAYHDFAGLGTRRTLKRLLEIYEDTDPADPPPPTRSIHILKMWAKEHHWIERLKEREKRLGAEAEQAMILDYVELKKKRLESVSRLKSMGDRLLAKFSARMDELDDISIQSLAYLVPTAIRAIELSNKEERTELGEDTDRDKVAIDKVMAAFDGVLPAEMKDKVRKNLLRLMAVPGTSITGVPGSEPIPADFSDTGAPN